MGEMADYFLEEVMDHEDNRTAYLMGSLSVEEAMDLGVLDEDGTYLTPGREINMPTVTKQTSQKVGRKLNAEPTKITNGKAEFLKGIIPVSDMPETGIKLLITGPSGTGKTTLACDLPKPLMLIRPESVENGALSVKQVKGVDIPPPLTDDFQLDWIVEMQMEEQKYATIVLDGAQFFQDLVMKRVLGLKEAPAQLSWGVASQQDWGVIGSEFKEILRRFFRLADIGTNVVITGGERIINAKDDGEHSLIPPGIVVAIQPSSAGWVNFICDYIVCTFVRQRMVEMVQKVGNKEIKMQKPGKGIEYCARLVPNEVYTAKFRVPKGTFLPDVLVDPTYAKIRNLIDGKHLEK